MASSADPTLPPPGPEWFPAALDRLQVPASGVLSATGYDAVVATDEEGWWFSAHPPLVLAGATVRGARPGDGWIAPGTVGRALARAEDVLSERWTVALDLPVAVWEVTGASQADVVLEWAVDLRRAAPGEPAIDPSLTVHLTDDGRRAAIAAPDGTRAELVVSGARMHVEPGASGRTMRFVCRGRTPVRVLVAAGTEPAALTRVAQSLRRTESDPVAARGRRESQAAQAATATRIPYPTLDDAFRWATHRLEALATSVPSPGRAVPTGRRGSAERGARDLGPSAVRPAVALLMVGRRDPARELIRAFASSLASRGPIPPPRRIARPGAPSDVHGGRAFLRLVERYAAWTGDLELLHRHGPAIAAVLASVADDPDAAMSPVRAAKSPVLWDRLLAGLDAPAAPPPLVESAREFLADPAVLDAGPSAAVVEAVLVGLWGVEPAAPDTSVTLRPAPPAEWRETALRRLRVGRTVLDVELRRRRGDLVVRVHRVYGPRMVVTLAPPGAFVGAVVDEVELSAPWARFEAGDRHEVIFRGVPG